MSNPNFDKNLEDVCACGKSFNPWVFETQKFPFKSCIDCRQKKKAEREAQGYAQPTSAPSPASPDFLERFDKIDERLDKLGDFLQAEFNKLHDGKSE